jgi:hypothetical protein
MPTTDTVKRQQHQQRYSQSDKGKAAQQRYGQSDNRKAYKQAYDQSGQGKAARKARSSRSRLASASAAAASASASLAFVTELKKLTHAQRVSDYFSEEELAAAGDKVPYCPSYFSE